MNYGKEHRISIFLWGALNVILLVIVLFKPARVKPLMVLTKSVEETTIIKQIATQKKSAGANSKGELPSLQMSYPSSADVKRVVQYFQMVPVILDSKSNIVFMVNLNDNSLIKIKNSSSLKKFSPRARRVPQDLFKGYIAAAGKSMGVDAEKLDIVVLVPNSVEKFFLDLERKALAGNNLEPGGVNLVRGKYERASGGYSVTLTEAVCTDGIVKELSEG